MRVLERRSTGYIIAPKAMTDSLIRAAFYRFLQTENRCAQTGKPCRDPEQCGCALEMQEYMEREGEARRISAVGQELLPPG